MIPKIIHQIWLGDQSVRPQKFIDTWINLNPTWTHKLWTEANIPKIENIGQYNAIGAFSGKADILRYELLKAEGGFFIDADAECIKPLEDWLLNNDSFACWESESVVPGLIANGYLASTPNNELMIELVASVSRISPNSINSIPPWQMTGPSLLTNTVARMRYNKLKVYPSHYFIPKHCRGNEYTGSDHVFCKQHWGSSFGLYGKIGMYDK